MQTVYIVVAENGMDEKDNIVATYTNRLAAEQHARLAQQWADAAHDRHLASLRSSMIWLAKESSPWDSEYVGIWSPPTYAVKELLLCDHPDQWQESRSA